MVSQMFVPGPGVEWLSGARCLEHGAQPGPHLALAQPAQDAVSRTPEGDQGSSKELTSFACRYTLFIFALLLLGVIYSEKIRLFAGQPSPGLVVVIRRLLTLVRASYRLHRMPCPVVDRTVTPLAMVIYVRDVDRRLCEEAGVKFASPTPSKQPLPPCPFTTKLTRVVRVGGRAGHQPG